MAAKYQYKLLQVPSGANMQDIEDALNMAGQQGWELVQVIQLGTNVYVIGRKILVA